MGDLHQVVVNYVGQVIGGVAIRFKKHKIVYGIALEGDLAADKVLKFDPPLKRGLEADHGGDALSLKLCPLFFGEIATLAVVARRLFPFHLLPSHLLEALRGAVAKVGIPLLHQALGYALIYLQALGLKIGAIIPAHLWTLVPIQSQPPEAIEDRL
jgi:hypothetical protein